MDAENSFDFSIKNGKYNVTRSLSDNNSEKGLLLAAESSSTGEFKGKQHFGLTSAASFGCVESQELNKCVKARRGFQEPDNLKFKKLQQLLRNIESVENTMRVDGNVIVGDVGKVEDCYKVDGSGSSTLKIKLIDDTAVIEPFPSIQKKKAKWPPHRKGKGANKAKMVNHGGAKKTYSREELLSMRFIGVVKQKRLWREEIYHGLGSAVAQEYASLVGINKNLNPRNPLASGILGPIAGSGRPNIAVHPNIITPFYAQNWPYVSQGSSPASSTT